jgi:hypothetical protein
MAYSAAAARSQKTLISCMNLHYKVFTTLVAVGGSTSSSQEH